MLRKGFPKKKLLFFWILPKLPPPPPLNLDKLYNFFPTTKFKIAMIASAAALIPTLE